MTTMDQPIELEQGWMVLQKHITKLKETLESKSNDKFLTSEEYIEAYQMIYNLCTQKTNDYSQLHQQLFDRYRQTLEDYLSSTVDVPRLREKSGESLLEELVQRWSNHNIMVRWLRRFFTYLDRYYIARKSLPSLHKVGINCFRDKVCDALNGEVVDAVITLVEQEQGGEKIDRALYKNVADVIPLISDLERDEGGESHGALLKIVAGILGDIYRGN